MSGEVRYETDLDVLVGAEIECSVQKSSQSANIAFFEMWLQAVNKQRVRLLQGSDFHILALLMLMPI